MVNKPQGAERKRKARYDLSQRVGRGRTGARATASATLAIATFIVTRGALADGPESWEQGHHGMWSGGWGGMMLGLPMMLLLILAVVALIVLAVRAMDRGGSGAAKTAGQTPSDILEERFARGEIDAQEFEERRRVLAKGSN